MLSDLLKRLNARRGKIPHDKKKGIDEATPTQKPDMINRLAHAQSRLLAKANSVSNSVKSEHPSRILDRSWDCSTSEKVKRVLLVDPFSNCDLNSTPEGRDAGEGYGL